MTIAAAPPATAAHPGAPFVKPEDIIIGPLQSKVMQYIWTNGESTVEQVATALNAADLDQRGAMHRRLAYTTFLTVMRNLVRRGFLYQRSTILGRAHRFTAKLTQRTYRAALSHHILGKDFDGRLDLFAKAATDTLDT